MQFVEDKTFNSHVSSGKRAELEIIDFLAIKGHAMVVRGNGAGSADVWKDGPKRDNTPDLACVHCGLIVESKAQKDHRIAVNHSEYRPWNVKLRPGHFVVIVYHRVYKFYRVEDLLEWLPRATPGFQPDGAPCLVWPYEVPITISPSCNSAAR